jgi:SPW repeat
MMEYHWRKEAWLNVLNLAAAAFLVVSPWLFGFASAVEASRNAWICGVAIGIVSIASIFAYAAWEDSASLVLGLWLIVSPWVLRFHDTVPSAMHVNVAIGIVVAVFAAGALWLSRAASPRMTARQ